MASTYTLNNGIELIGTGEQSGTWGDTTNTNLSLVDTALDGQVTVTLPSAGTSGSPNTLAISDGAASDGRNRMVIFNDGGDLGATAYVQLTPNDAEKIIYVRNDLAGSRSIILFQGTYNASNDYELPAGTTAVIYFDGAGSGAVAANVFNNAYFDSLRLGSVSVTEIIDDDTMATAAATNIATSESIKAYVDSQVTAQDLDFAGDSGTGAVDLDSQSLTIAGTTNEIETSASGQTLTIGLPDDVTIAGDLTVDTDTLYVDSTNNRVGINTSSPSYAIDVVGLTDNSIYAEFSNNSSRALRLSSFAVGVNDNAGHDFNASSSAGALSFSIDENEAMRVDSVRRVLIGHTSSIQIGAQEATLQVMGTGAGASTISAVRFANSANSSKIQLGKSRGSSVGTNVIVQDNDNVGSLGFSADDGTDVESQSASINAEIDGTPGVDDTPGRLVFSTTADGANSVTERMRITSQGYVGIGTTPNYPLDVQDSGGGFIKASFVSTGSSHSSIVFDNTGSSANSVRVGSQNNDFYVRTSSTEAMRIDSSQRVLIGHTSSVAVGSSSESIFQVNDNDSFTSVARYTAGTGGPLLSFGKAKTNTLGGVTLVADGDSLGLIRFAGADGTDLQSAAAQITAKVDGTPGSNDMPGRLEFYTTADGAASPTERMRITNGGRVGINTASESGAPLGWLTIDNDINSADILTNKASYHIALGLDGGHTNNYIGGIGFGDVVTSEIQAAITAVDAGTSAATSLAFVTGNTSAVNEAMRINSNQQVLINFTDYDTSTDPGSFASKLQLRDTNYQGSSISLSRYVNATSAPAVVLGKSRGSSVTTNGLVSNGDTLGLVLFYGDDGEDLNATGARIMASVDGTAAANDMPGRLTFLTTADGTTTSTERMRISENGDVDIGQTGGGVKLAVAGAVGPQNGSESAPTHTFYSDTDTGMYRAALDTIRFTTGGTDAMQISSTQNTTLYGDLFLSKDSSSSNFMEIRFNDQDTGVGSGQKLGAVTAYSNDTQRDGIVGEIAFVYQDSSPDCNIEFKTYQNSTDTYTPRWKIQYNGALVNTASSAPANIVMASGTGVQFQDAGGTGTSSSTLLDSYEEGTWTPVYSALGGGSIGTSTVTSGYYVKVGKMVQISFQIASGSISSPSGEIQITGLPFTASSQTDNRAGFGIGFVMRFGADMPNFCLGILDNVSYIRLHKNATNASGSSPVQGSDLSGGANQNYIYASATYQTA